MRSVWTFGGMGYGWPADGPLGDGLGLAPATGLGFGGGGACGVPRLKPAVGLSGPWSVTYPGGLTLPGPVRKSTRSTERPVTVCSLPLGLGLDLVQLGS